jgi:thiol-disulfide isomerase/thioredoxin
MPAMRLGIALLALVLLPAAAPAAVGVGDEPPRLTLPDADGRPVALAEAGRGKVVLLDFWASWCAPCAAALPALDAIARRHADAGLVVVAIGIDRDREQARRFLAERLPHPVMTLVYDPGGAAMARFGAAGMPALYLLDRAGVVRRMEAGYAPAALDGVEDEARKLLEKRMEGP